MNVSIINVILKRIKACSRDVIIEGTDMKEKHEIKNDELVFKAQNITDSSTKVKLT